MTIRGPVGNPENDGEGGEIELITVPMSAERDPKSADRSAILGMLLVHSRAVAGGMTRRATINTAPTAGNPQAVHRQRTVMSTMSRRKGESPCIVPNVWSKQRAVSSLKRSTITAIERAETPAIRTRSDLSIVEAFPKINVSIPALLTKGTKLNIF